MIKNIVVSGRSLMEMHRANNGKDALGNESSIKETSDGRVYVSGQMQRHSLFEAIERLDESEETYVSKGDGTTLDIEKDLAADLRGFMHPNISNDPGRRSSPVKVKAAVSEEKSNTIGDLLLRLNRGENGSPSPVTQEVSESDVMSFGFSLNCLRLSTTKRFKYDGELHVETEVIQHVSEEEKMRRALLFLEAANSLNDFSSQARNAANMEPFEVLIVLDTRLKGKPLDYFDVSEVEQEVILRELDHRGAEYFYGNDRDQDEDDVFEAFEKAKNRLQENTIGYEEVDEVGLDYRDTFPNVDFPG